MKRTAALLATAALTACLSATTAATSVPASAAPPAEPQDRRAAAVARADRHVAEQRGAVAAGPEERFSVRDVVLDGEAEGGGEHVRYDRTYRGLPVLGGDVVVHSGREGQLRSVSRTQRSGLSLSTRATVTPEQATETARQAAQGQVTPSGEPRLVVHTRGAQPRLAYDVLLTGTSEDGDPSELHVVVDALDRRVLEASDDIHTAKPTPAGTPATATGTGLYDGTVSLDVSLSSGTYSMRDLTRGGQTTADLLGATSGTGRVFTSTTPSFGASPANRANAGVDAQYGAAETWDYFLSHGRRGIANDGKGAPSRVHYGSAYNNAFWSDSCFCMTFGDGDGVRFNPLVSVDVAGHEMSHGVTSRTARLVYSGESGGLNEATSDIFGTMVEFAAGLASDPGDYTVGEEIVPAGAKPLRYMYQPSLDGKSPDCYSSTLGGLDVHYSSGVGNRFYFLLAEGSASPLGNGAATCSGSTVTGIGQAAAGKIWYRALTLYMTSSTTYAGARNTTLQAATDLYGAASPQRAAVAAAWSAVRVG